MVNENTPLEIEHFSNELNEKKEMKELKPILTSLISLCDKIVVYSLDKEKEAFIERVFFESITTCQKIKW